MTFGEKLKEARKEAALSQEQLAEKLSVSRSAVAKWESDKGMPDINNLKAIAQLLNVSIDYLLDDGKRISFSEIKEAIDLNDYEKTGKCRNKRDAACIAKFTDADAIFVLVRNKKMNKSEWWLDFLIQPGIVEVLDRFKESANYYLVEKGMRQYLVKVTDDFIITNELAEKVDGKSFIVDEYRYLIGLDIA